MKKKTPRPDERLEALFAKAEEMVGRAFAQERRDSRTGRIRIFDEPYVLVRAASLSREFFTLARELFGKGRREEADAFARNILFDLAHAIGRADAKLFHQKLGVTDPLGRLSLGTVLFSHCGWGNVEVSPRSHPTADDDFCLLFDHAYSFESEAWLQDGHRADFPVCIMNAGYSSGWCEESFGIPLVASEILCRARGDDGCRFVMAPPHRIEEQIRALLGERPGHLRKRVAPHEIPDFFARKRAEDALRKSEELYRTLAEAAPDAIFIIGEDGRYRYINAFAASQFRLTPEQMVGRPVEEFFPARTYEKLWRQVRGVLTTGRPFSSDELIEFHDRKIWLSTTIHPLRSGGKRVEAAMGTSRDITQRKRIEERLTRLNECFLGFGLDPIENINRLVTVLGELLGATCTLYNRLTGEMLCSLARWNTPPDFKTVDRAEGHICADVIRRGGEALFIERDLLRGPFAKSDPSVLRYNLETYVGKAVRCGDRCVGSICAVFQWDFLPSEQDAELFGIIGAAVGAEERRLEASRSLEESEAKYRALVETARDIIVSLDGDGIILYASPQVARYGLTPERIVGKPMDAFVHPEDAAAIRTVFEGAKETSEEFSTTFRVTNPRGELFWFEAFGRARRDDGGRFAGVNAILRDVTDRRRTEEELGEKMGELERMSSFLIGRESRVLEVKLEVNALLRELGRPEKYTII